MLRSKSLLRTLDTLATPLFGDQARVLHVGVERGERPIARIEEVESGSIGSFGGAVWRPEGDLQLGLRTLRTQLAPGAKLLVVAPLVPAWWRATRELLGARAALRLSRDVLCERLLLAGWLWPRVWLDGPRLLCVSAELPVRPDPLDTFFTQPLAT